MIYYTKKITNVIPYKDQLEIISQIGNTYRCVILTLGTLNKRIAIGLGT